jgi:protease-4
MYMARFLIGVLTGIVLIILVLVISVFALFKMRDKPPTIADGSTLILQVDGEIPERPPIELPLPFLQDRASLTVQNIWGLLRRAASDARIKAVVLAPGSLRIGWAKAQEIHADLEQFKKSGKPLIAYLRTPSAKEYYLATACNRIYLAPEDWLNLKGLRLELMYFKKTLDKLGVSVQVEHAGKYKDFGDMFTRTGMTPETREVLNSVLDGLYGNLVETIAAGRKKTAQEVRDIIDQGPFISSQTVPQGLVDEVRYEDQMFGELKMQLKGGDIKKVSAAKYLRALAGEAEEGRNRVAFLVGQGAITRGDPDDTGIADEGITSQGFNKLLRQVANDSQIKAAIVRIDSPGGEVTASEEIWREMGLLSKKKPVVISMSDTAASGGYYISMTGDPVLSYPGTLTGSIGVVYGKPDLHGLYDKLGINKEMLKRGRFADIDSDYTALDQDELAKLRFAISENYKDFVKKVADARKRPFDQIEPLAQGRVWLGSQAKDNGLVDELGGLDRALELLKKKANIPAGEKVTLVAYPPRRSLIDILLSRGSENAVESRIRALIGMPARVWLKAGFFRMMPYAIEVR